MLLFDISNMDIDAELDSMLEMLEYSEIGCNASYLIMSEVTFNLFKLMSRRYDKKQNKWFYDGIKDVPDTFDIAIDKKLNFGEVMVK